MQKYRRCKSRICGRVYDDEKMTGYLEKMIVRTLMFLTEEIQILKTFKPDKEMLSDITDGGKQFLLYYADFFAVERFARGLFSVNIEKISISRFLQSLSEMFKYQSKVTYKVEKTLLNPADDMEVDLFMLSQVFRCLLTITDKDNQAIKGGCLHITNEEVIFFVDRLLTTKTVRKGEAFCKALNRNYAEELPQIPFEVKCAMIFYYIDILKGRSLAYVNEEGEVCFKFVLPRFKKEFSPSYKQIDL